LQIYVYNSSFQIELKYAYYSIEFKNNRLSSVTSTTRVCFAGDLGGYFGLFLGGSAISLFEVLDLIIYNAFVKLTTTAQLGPNNSNA